MLKICSVVSAHGYGHAARACAVMDALSRQHPDLGFEILTTVPEWFFAQSLRAKFAVHCIETDVGLVQRTPLEEDLAATVHRLDEVMAEGSRAAERLTATIADAGCEIVMCDIAPLGLVAADRLNLPGVLIENFTWDWIYRGYVDAPRELRRHANRLAPLIGMADLHIQTEPVCFTSPDAHRVAPVSRCPRTPAATVRDRLRVPNKDPLILLTMGGVGWDYRSLEELGEHGGAWFVVPGGSELPDRRGTLITLPFRSRFFHPDLVHASEVVVGKLGYSTVAETHSAGAAMAYIGRPRSPESASLERFVTSEMSAIAIDEETFRRFRWLDVLGELLDAPRPSDPRENGAEAAARLILERYSLV